MGSKVTLKEVPKVDVPEKSRADQLLVDAAGRFDEIVVIGIKHLEDGSSNTSVMATMNQPIAVCYNLDLAKHIVLSKAAEAQNDEG